MSRSRQTHRVLLMVVLPLTLLTTAPRVTRAQATSTVNPIAGILHPGTRVRVTTPRFGAYQPVGRYLGMSGDTLLLEREAQETPLRILVERKTRIEVSTSQTPGTGTGFLIGALAGGLFGLIATEERSLGNMGSDGLDAVNNGTSLHDNWFDGSPLLLGLAVGGLTGALIGSLYTSDTWGTLPMPLDRTRAEVRLDAHGSPCAVVTFRL